MWISLFYILLRICMVTAIIVWSLYLVCIGLWLRYLIRLFKLICGLFLTSRVLFWDLIGRDHTLWQRLLYLLFLRDIVYLVIGLDPFHWHGLEDNTFKWLWWLTLWHWIGLELVVWILRAETLLLMCFHFCY